MRDFIDDVQFEKWQSQLDSAGVDFDITNLCGCTFDEIQAYVNLLLNSRK